MNSLFSYSVQALDLSFFCLTSKKESFMEEPLILLVVLSFYFLDWVRRGLLKRRFR